MQPREPAHHVSPRAVAYWSLRAVPFWILVLAGELFWLWSSRDRTSVQFAVLSLTVLFAAVHLIVMPRWRYRVHRWEVTDTTVDTERGPLEQLFSLANVTVTTASAAGPLRIHGLDRATAEGVVSELTEVTSHSQGDAT